MTPPTLEGRRPLPPVEATPNTNGRAHKRKSPSTSHRFQQINEFIDITLRNLSPVAGLTWLAIWREARAPEWKATVSQKSLRERIGVSESTLKRAVKELEEARLLSVVRRGNSITGSSTYEIRPKGEACKCHP